PTPTPTPAPTPVDPMQPFFCETPLLTEYSYHSKGVSITVETRTVQLDAKQHATCYIADIHVQDVTSIRTAAAKGTFDHYDLQLVGEIAAEAGAIVAINGDTYLHFPNSLVVRNGEVYRKKPIEGEDICILYRDGVMETKKWGTFRANDVLDADPWQVWNFGPALLDADGGAMEINHHLGGPNPRSAIGYFEPGHYCFVTVDGRGESAGMTLTQLSRFMEELGCKVAYNLDGGASAQMYWNGGIISTPSAQNRIISDIVCILPEG
ncbi:MAG: phosphodiester glycosidase family protein, partial [Clostridia bacterium]|nr:phosphodiester glycosidase family protein [Clostridia bacterium]